MDWTKYLNEEETNIENEIVESEEIESTELINSNDLTYLDMQEINHFLQKLSGRDENGKNKAVISYQTYAMEDSDDSPEKNQVYTTSNPCIELSLDKNYPNFYMMDISFRSCDDPELKMLWGRLQKFKKNMRDFPDKTWIFYFNILEKASVTLQTSINDTLVTANVFNPQIFYLTREVPNLLATNVVDVNGELSGGNVIRMLIPIEFISFKVDNDIDTNEIKGEVFREEEARDYLDNAETNNNQWDE